MRSKGVLEMKKAMMTFALLMSLSGGHIGAGHAQAGSGTAPSNPVLRAIRQNAADASENAAIYQWKRVNREVDRIVVDARRAAKAFAADASKADQVEALRKAVRDL